MHVALLIGSLTRGGSERVMVNLADYLTGCGHRVTMVTQYTKENEYPLNEKVKRVISDITEEETGGNRAVNFYKRFRKLRAIWKTEQPDVIVSFFGKNNMMSILTSRFLPVAVAVAIRANPPDEYYNRWMRGMAKGLFRYADGVILQTEGSRGFFPHAVARKSVVLKNPVNPDFFIPRYEGEREKRIVAAGRIDQNKNHQLLINAFAMIAEEYPDYQLVIYGEGELRPYLNGLIREMGLEKRILLPGISRRLSEALYKARLFVLTSDSEGVPNALLEAMLMGLTVLSTDCPCGGPADLIDHKRNGLLTPVGDVNKMKENLLFVLQNQQAADRMGTEAARLQSLYEYNEVLKSWETYLKTLCLEV